MSYYALNEFANELTGEGPLYKQTEKYYKQLYPYSTLGYWMGLSKKKKNMAYGNRRVSRSRFTRKSRPTYRRTLYRAKPKFKMHRRKFTRSRTFRRRR